MLPYRPPYFSPLQPAWLLHLRGRIHRFEAFRLLPIKGFWGATCERSESKRIRQRTVTVCPLTAILGEILTLHANDLLQCVERFHQISLVRHDLINVLVGSGDLVNNVDILPAFNALGLLDKVFLGECVLGLCPTHYSTGTVAA